MPSMLRATAGRGEAGGIDQQAAFKGHWRLAAGVKLDPARARLGAQQ